MRWTTPPPCDGVERTVRPRTSSSSGVERDHPVLAEVLGVLRDELGNHGRTGIANSLEGRARVGRVHTRRIAVDPTAPFVAQKDPVEDPVQRLARLVADEAFAGEPDGRLDQVTPCTRGEAAVNLFEAGEQPGDCDRPLPDVEDLCPGIAEVDEQLLHLAEPDSRNTEEAVEHDRRVAGLVDEREAAPSRAGQRPLRHECRERSRQERVDGVPTVAQHTRAGLGRERVTGCDRAAHRGTVLRLSASRCSGRTAAPGRTRDPPPSSRTRDDRLSYASHRARSRRPSPRPGRSGADRPSRRR